MTGPWEKYAAQDSGEAGPWAKYVAAPAAPSRADLWKREGMSMLAPLRGAKDLIDTGSEWLSKLAGPEVSARVKAENDAGKAEWERSTNGGFVAPVGRVAGQAVGAAPVLSAAGAGLTAAGLTRLGSAFASGGMSTGAAPAGAMAKLGDMGIRMAGGAGAGGVSAGLVDPGDAGTGAAIGAALPGAMKLAGAVGQGLGHAAAAVSDKAARANALRQVAGVVDDPQALRRVIPGAESVPLSAAARTNSPAIAQLEQGSRLRSAPAWSDFDARQSSALWGNVRNATAEAEGLGAAKAARSKNWNDGWAKAEGAVPPDEWAARITSFDKSLAALTRSKEAANPQVRGAISAVRDEIGRMGPDFSPGHLQVLRAELNGKVPMNPANALKAAPRDSPATISLINELDDLLGGATRGGWDKVRQGYAADSGAVHASKAAGLVRESFEDAATGRIRGVAADGDVPRITEAGIGRAMDKARLPDRSLALSPQANDQLEATLQAIRSQNGVQRLKKTATAGGDSGTVSNLLAARVPGGGLLGEALSMARRAAVGRTDDQLARLLSSPDELAELLLQGRQRSADPQIGLLGLYRAAPLTASGQ